MAQPNVSIHINTGSESSPTWREIISSETIYFTGPDTTSTTLDPVTAPVSGNKWAEQLWGGTASSHDKCNTFIDPTSSTQYKNVLRVYFADNPTSTPPEMTSWDDTTHSTTNMEMLQGTANTSNTSFIKAIETTAGAPSQNWCDYITATSGSSNVNALKGDDNFIRCSSVASANSEKTFALAVVVPSDATSGETGHTPVLTIRYTYT